MATPINPFAPPNPAPPGAPPPPSNGDSFLRASLIVAAISGGFWLLSRVNDRRAEEEKLEAKIREYEEAEAEGAHPTTAAQPGVVIVMPPGGSR